MVAGMKTLLEVRVPVMAKVLFAFLSLVAVGTLPILVGLVGSVATFSSLDDGVTKGWYDLVSSRQ